MENESQESQNKKPNTLVLGLIVIAVLFVGGWAVFSRSRTSSPAPATSTQKESQMLDEESTEAMMGTEEGQQSATGDAMMQDEGMTEGDATAMEANAIKVEGGSFYFKPNEIRVKVGEPVTIAFTNAGGTHDFVLDEFDVRTSITQTGDTEEVSFTPTEKGEFEFYCSVGNHRALGMTGTLIVE